MILYYYGFEVRCLTKCVYVSSRNDSRYSNSFPFKTLGEAYTWIDKVAGLT